jgi:flagellar hook-associated protein 3 FlgL
MRVTDRMLFDRANRDGGAARTRLEEAIARASTGQRLVHPGDDPAGAGLVNQHQAAAARADAIMGVAQSAGDELAAVDGAFNDVTNALSRARELATQFANAPYTAAQRAAAAGEAQSLISQMVAALNTRVGSRYVMGGTLDGTPPFDAAGNYSGDTAVRQVEVAPGVLENASVRADVAVKGVGGGVDVMTTLAQLVTALQANDQAGVRATLDGIAAGTDQVAVARTQVGNAMNTFDVAAQVNRTARDDATSRAAHLTDADIIDANSQLALAQRALEASLTATTAGFKLTLLNYLK